MTRLTKRNNAYMKLPDGLLALWYDVTTRFGRWAVAKGVTKTAIMSGFKPENRGMGNVWAEFLRETGHPGTKWVDPEVEMARRGLEGLSFADSVAALSAV